MSTFSEIKLDIFWNLFRTEFIFRYEKIIFLGFFRRNFFISEISERLSKELTSSVINAPSCPVIIQSTGKDLTNLHKFLARVAVCFLFRYSLPLFRPLVPVWITTMPGFLCISGLMWSSRSFIDVPGWGRTLTESPRDTSLSLAFFYWIPNDNDVLLYFCLMSLTMKVFKTNLQFFKSVILWNV